MRENVVLCWVSPGMVNARFMNSVLDAVVESVNNPESAAIVGYFPMESGPRIAHARNVLVRKFLTDERYKHAEWLLMLDTDITFDKEMVTELLSNVRTPEGKIRRPVVGGLYFGGGHGSVFPLMFDIVDPKANDGNPIKYITDWIPGETIEVDATGAGCLLMHRETLEAMANLYPEPHIWFAESVHNGREFGEDWTFCVRVRQMGLPIYVNTAVEIGHMKAVELNENTWRHGEAGLKQVDAPVVTRQQKRRRERAA